MHPIVTITLAEQHNAELLRVAKQRRRAAGFGNRRSPFSHAAQAVTQTLTRLRGLAVAPVQTPADPCCA